MAYFVFAGNLVGAVSGANDISPNGIKLILDNSQDLDGNGNPYYASSDNIIIEIADEDIGPDGELIATGGEITVNSLTVNGVEQLSGPDKIKLSDGSETYQGDAYFFLENVKLFFLTPYYSETFSDSTLEAGELVLNLPERVADMDFDQSGGIDLGTAEVGNGIYNIQAQTMVCFVRGTQILTSEGRISIEHLQPGDKVCTMDNGHQEIRWIGSRTVPATGRFAPIRIRTGALRNDRDLLVSPQHRMLLSGWQLELLFASNEVLATAISLVNYHSILRQEGGEVEYFHFLLDTHQIVFAEGAPTESFHPEAHAMESFSDATREEIYSLFPELRNDVGACGKTARLCLKKYDGILAGCALGLKKPKASVSSALEVSQLAFAAE